MPHRAFHKRRVVTGHSALHVVQDRCCKVFGDLQQHQLDVAVQNGMCMTVELLTHA